MRYLLLIIFLIFAGCATKEFEDPNAKSINLKSKTHSLILKDYTRKALTFKKAEGIFDKKYVNYTINGIKLGKFKKIDKKLAIYANKIMILKTKKIIKLPYLVFNATKNNNLIAIVFENDGYGVYDLDKNKLIFYQKDDDAIVAKYLSQKPIFYQDLILFPLLDGKIAVVDSKNMQFIRDIDISDDFIIDNVIYMNIVKNNLFMATPKRLVLFNPNFLISYKDSIKHVIDLNGYLYVFNNEGKVIKFDSNLKKIKEVNFPFASFFAPSVCNGNIYTITYSGYLIKLTPNLKYSVYKTDQFDTSAPLRIKGCKIYNQDKVFFIE